jgi:hypothetical protein
MNNTKFINRKIYYFKCIPIVKKDQIEQLDQIELYINSEDHKRISNIFTDLLNLNPKIDNFETKNDKYGGYSISDIINYIYNYKHYLFAISDYYYNNTNFSFNLSGINLTLTITKEDIKILKTFKVGNLCCAKCGNYYPYMKRCSGCTFVKYCNNDCQHNDWHHHQKICKNLQKIRSFKNKLSDTPIGVSFIDKTGNSLMTETTEQFIKKMKDIKDKRKSKSIIPHMYILTNESPIGIRSTPIGIRSATTYTYNN